MKRVIDKYSEFFSVHAAAASGICVKCPACSGLGMVTTDQQAVYFKCTNCGKALTKRYTIGRCDVHNQCEECGRYYRVNITDKRKQHFKTLHVVCPYCGHVMLGEVQRMVETVVCYGEIRHACEPFFGFELWFLTSFHGKPVWALNREHLAYLIEYLRADLREKPVEYKSKRTQADHLPTFMKTAKNRGRMVKLLQNMQQS